MKIDRLETHDRLEQFQKQSLDISECCKNLVDRRPFGPHPFYIFFHARTDDNGVDKRLIWNAWLRKPNVQTNSKLVKVYPGSDKVIYIWDLPDRVLWPQFIKGNMLESSLVCKSIQQFEEDKEVMMYDEPDDVTPELAQELTFDYFPLLFKRETLSPDKQIIWDAAKKVKEDLILKQKFEKSGYKLL